MKMVVPPGQTLTHKFPVVGERTSEPASLDLGSWELAIDGKVDYPQCFRVDQVRQLPRVEWVMDVHCVTGWSKLGVRWVGVPLHALLPIVRPHESTQYVRFEAHSSRNHDSSLPLNYAAQHVLLAYECEGQPLTPEHGFPLRSVARGKYFYKSVKWLRRIEFMEQDQLGYWEGTYSYHNGADPWQEERYASQPMAEDEFRFRLAQADFSRSVAIMDTKFMDCLEGRELDGASFRQAQVKACKFRRVRLCRADFRQANLTASSFVNCNLEGADFRGCDLEGADFRGSNLKHADFRGCLLTATRFRRSTNDPILQGARFHTENLADLLENEADFIRAHGAIIEEAITIP